MVKPAEMDTPGDANNDPVCQWPAPSAHPPCDCNEVHVWCRNLAVSDAERHLLEGWLSPDEIVRSQRFRFDRDRMRFIVRRATLRALLGSYIGAEPDAIAFTYGARGKPVLGPPFDAGIIDFNMSHSNGLGLFAFTRERQIGVDVEAIRALDDADIIARRFFTAPENAALNSVVTSQRADAFYNCWTRKEAFVKATGEGLQRPLDSFVVSLVPGEPARLLSSADGDVDAWSLQSVTPAPGFVGAVAARGADWTLRCWQWPQL